MANATTRGQSWYDQTMHRSDESSAYTVQGLEIIFNINILEITITCG